MIKIICTGKLKEKYLQDAVKEYEKRLSAYTKLEIIQVDDEKCPENASEAIENQVREKEGERILRAIKDNDFVITLEIKGRMLSSEELAEYIAGLQIKGISDMDFVIGGSIGLSNAVSARSNMKLSFSAMTFPHQLMRVILLEQIYRAYKINRHEPYHK